MAKGDNGFDKDPERARAAGRKSRKSGEHLKTIIRRFLDQKDDSGLTAEERIILNLVAKAEDGDNLNHIKEIFDRLYGKAMQSTEISGPDGSEIKTATKIEVLPVAANKEEE